MALVRIRAKIEKNTLFGRAFVRVRAKMIKKKHPCGKALARVRAKIEDIILFGRALVRIRSEIEKNTLFDRTLTRKKKTFGRALVRIRTIEE